jgi:hypothetical protein
MEELHLHTHIRLHGIMLIKIKHRDNFTFTSIIKVSLGLCWIYVILGFLIKLGRWAVNFLLSIYTNILTWRPVVCDERRLSSVREPASMWRTLPKMQRHSRDCKGLWHWLIIVVGVSSLAKVHCLHKWVVGRLGSVEFSRNSTRHDVCCCHSLCCTWSQNILICESNSILVL